MQNMQSAKLYEVQNMQNLPQPGSTRPLQLKCSPESTSPRNQWKDSDLKKNLQELAS